MSTVYTHSHITQTHVYMHTFTRSQTHSFTIRTHVLGLKYTHHARAYPHTVLTLTHNNIHAHIHTHSSVSTCTRYYAVVHHSWPRVLGLRHPGGGSRSLGSVLEREPDGRLVVVVQSKQETGRESRLRASHNHRLATEIMLM